MITSWKAEMPLKLSGVLTIGKKKEARELAELADSAGKIPLLQKQFDTVAPIAESVWKTIRNCVELEITNMQADGDAELSYIWQEGETWIRTRTDWISKDRNLILDVKTTGKSADPDEFSRHIADMGYDIQAALYRRGVQILEGKTPEFVFIAVEIKEPYLCCPVSLSAEFMELGNQKVEAGIALWRHCMKTDNWPGYPKRVCWAEVKPWVIASWESKKFDIERMING